MTEAKREPVPPDWLFHGAIALIAILAIVRVAATHRVFSEVLDEPAHLAAGFMWFEGNHAVDPSHPPLARILGALPLRLAGFPVPAAGDMVTRGNELLYHGDRYHKTLARVRIGNLLLLAVAIAATALWTRRHCSRAIAILSAALLATMPAVLGHAGVLTTDLAALATLPLALLALEHFFERQRWLLFGVAIGLGLLAKFSFLVYFIPCALIAFLFLRPKPRLYAIALALVTAFVVVWGGYRFDFRTTKDFAGDFGIYALQTSAPKPLQPLAIYIAEHVPIPAPSFAIGLAQLKIHNRDGHDAYLLGEMRRNGWWYYFPVVFFYKTPLAFLFFALWGAHKRAAWPFLAMAIAIMLMAMSSSINIGVRHVLPLYAPLAVVAAIGIADIASRTKDAFGRTAFAALLAWLFIGTAIAHPDYLAWFNELAGPNPARIAIDSNLDWGQDSLRLARYVREQQLETLHVDILTNVKLERHGIHHIPFNAWEKTSGWLAVSETQLAFKGAHGGYAWLSAYRPVARVGASIRIYTIP